MARVVTTVDGVIGLIEYEIERLTNILDKHKGSHVSECILLGRRLQMHELLCIIEGLKTTYYKEETKNDTGRDYQDY